MATNIERQHSLDKKKYFLSQKNKTDMSGKMPYCTYCKYCKNNSCLLEQVDREMNCVCATAFNRMVRKNIKKL